MKNAVLGVVVRASRDVAGQRVASRGVLVDDLRGARAVVPVVAGALDVTGLGEVAAQAGDDVLVIRWR
ncbi:hypothetical protein ACFV0T_25115 [Streptomyces sp. NPDC059582]|uniref:hypothetical protein n=1 Tax=Streptomyces sp. NPDC059582 TaxID=3346875 RepID=UPI003688FE7A